jgi:hypothetical protein
MKYYYLDGIEKKGPYTKEEILSRNLSPDTLIYREDKTNWTTLSNLEELNVIEPIESKDISVSVSESQVEHEDIKDNIESKKILLPKNTVLILYIVVSIGLAALITYLQQKVNYNKISDDINLLFQNKTTISDSYISESLDGKLFDVIYHAGIKSNPVLNRNDFVTVNNILLATEPNMNQEDDNSNFYERNYKQWALYKDLKQYFIKEHYVEGFKVLKLSRSSDNFTITSYIGGDMAYKVLDKIHKSGTDYGYFSTPGYDIPTYRPSIKNCYIGAADYLTKEDEDSSYVSGSYSKILGMEIGYYKNDFYEIKQIGDKYFKWNDTIHVIRTDGSRSYVIDDAKITSSTSRNDGYIFNSDWVVWYKNYYNQYSLEPKKWAFLIYFSKYSCIGIILSLIIYFIVKNRKRIVINQN